MTGQWKPTSCDFYNIVSILPQEITGDVINASVLEKTLNPQKGFHMNQMIFVQMSMLITVLNKPLVICIYTSTFINKSYHRLPCECRELSYCRCLTPDRKLTSTGNTCRQFTTRVIVTVKPGVWIFHHVCAQATNGSKFYLITGSCMALHGMRAG